MKAKAITRIVIYGLITMMLLGILTGGIIMKGIPFINFSTGIVGGTKSSSGTADSTTVNKLDINWTSGNITLRTAEIEEIQFEESGVTRDENRMVWKVSQDTLTIQSSEGTMFFGVHIDIKKDLVITVPLDWVCNELAIDSAAASVTCSGITAGTVELNSASGEADFNLCDINELEIDTASGNVHYSGYLNTMDCSAVSADITAHFIRTPSKISVDGISGDLEITLPEDAGFRMENDTISGNIDCDFDTAMLDDTYVAGDGKCEIEIDGISGNVRIHKHVELD
ncbi:MAG: DUF4097 family beta strand repeat protein [Oscillospiraceae bacterium]|nr:DUF4097 family beta strand repeat protein [Oscillospiraceae bacterium]